MLWYFVESLLSLSLLYAIMATVIEFRFGKKRCLLVISLAICATVSMDVWRYLHGIGSSVLYAQAWATTCIPSFLCLYYLAKYRDGSFFFVYLTECVLASVITILAHIFSCLLPWQSDIFPVLLHTAMLAGLLSVCRRFFRNNFFEAAREQGNRWIFYCLLPLMYIVFWVMYTGSATRLTDIENKIDLPYVGYVYPRDTSVLIILMIIIFYTVSLVLIVITITHRAETERREKTLLYLQSRTLKDRISTLEDKDESLRILRHDMRHHLSTLSGLIDNKDLTPALDYISQLDRNLGQTKQESYCANAVINAVISYYAANARKEGIRFSAQVQIPSRLPVDDMDIGAVMSNALENAQNACMELPPGTERFIELIFIQHKKQFALAVSNSYGGHVEFGSDGCPVSKRESHGIGSQSIFAFSKKYGATVDYAVKKAVFNIRILFADAD